MLKVKIPTFLTIIVGVFVLLNFFITTPWVKAVAEEMNQWGMIVFAMALVLGSANLLRVNLNVIRRRAEDWPYKAVLVASMLFMAGVGVVDLLRRGHVSVGSYYNLLYLYVYTPLGSTMFALLAFFIASAAFRASRARSVRAALLLIAAALVMIGRVPLGAWLWETFPKITGWLMAVPNAAGQRGLIIGAAMGMIATGLRIIFGIERPYLRGE